MAKWIFQGDDAPSNSPPAADYVPPGLGKWNPPKAANGNDGGALWWDHDDPGQPGNEGAKGYGGSPGLPGLNGGDTPQGYKLIIPPAPIPRSPLCSLAAMANRGAGVVLVAVVAKDRTAGTGTTSNLPVRAARGASVAQAVSAAPVDEAAMGTTCR